MTEICEFGKIWARIEENYSLKLPRIPNQRNFWLIFGMDELMTSKSLLLDAKSSPESSGMGLKSGSAYDLVDLVTLAPLMMQFCQLVYFADIKVGQYLSRQVLRPSYVISLLLFIPIFILVSFSGWLTNFTRQLYWNIVLCTENDILLTLFARHLSHHQKNLTHLEPNFFVKSS